MVVDIGEKFSNIVAFRKTIFIFQVNAGGGESLTRAISVNLGLDMAMLKNIKRRMASEKWS